MTDKETHTADPPLDAGTGPDDGTRSPEPGDGSTAPTRHRRPRWVKVSLIIVLALIVLFVVLQLTGVAPEGGHGPDLHG